LNTTKYIRKFTEEDREKLKEIYLLCRTQSYYWCDSAQFHIDDFEAHTQDEEIWVAILGQEIVGFIAVWPPDSFIHHLYVDPVHRDEGIGKMLLATVSTKYQRPLKLKCLEKNEAALNFYKTQDWQIIGEGNDALGYYYLMESR
jgi:ribosomal protein S18 acetylase RimI-like enzyme